MLYRFRYLNGADDFDFDSQGIEFTSDAEAIRATNDGIRCMISDRIRQRLPMCPETIVEVSDESGRLVHQLAIADLLDAARFDDRF